MKEEKFINGFNTGYLLAKHEPEVVFKVLKNLNSKTDYVQGIVSGHHEFELERFQSYSDDLTRIRNKSQNRDNNLERE